MGKIIRNEALTIGTTSLSISNPKKRSSIYLYNSSSGGASASVITVTFSDVEAAVANVGYVLNPKNQIIDAVSEGYEVWGGSISAISDTAGASLTIVERD